MCGIGTELCIALTMLTGFFVQGEASRLGYYLVRFHSPTVSLFQRLGAPDLGAWTAGLTVYALLWSTLWSIGFTIAAERKHQ